MLSLDRLRLIQSKNIVTKPTTKASSSKNSSKKRPLTLKLFVNLPLDVVIEICTNVEPADLLSLSRVSKSFRTFFMSRSMQSLWRTVLEGVPYLPKCPEDLTEPQYASLVFDEFCMVFSLQLWSFPSADCGLGLRVN
ncbi:hypothetical protein CVT26_010148 [Gymnopilus dilepis]|uniref:F-box domain-containing protein n=1 Tax=Gymnopilus dilepis TaxID=231916 RepID=A0A409YS30_9AGAR|nr:hypothetical protein CVT26_010148 [Gymnopilus dilepis]